MTLPTCDHVRDTLPEALAGTLPGEAAHAVLAHLAECADCRAEAELVRTLRQHAPMAPAGLEARIRGAVALRRAPWWLARGSRPALLAASLVGALLGGAALLHRGGTPPPASAPSGAPPAPAALAEPVPASAPDVRGLAQPLPGSGEGSLFAGGGNGDDLSEEELKTVLQELQS